MIKRTSAIVLASLLAALAMSADASAASGNRGRSGSGSVAKTTAQGVRLEADLKATPNIPGIEADAKYEKKPDSGGTIREKFEGKVEIPVNNSLGIDSNSTFDLILPSATCTLHFDEVESELTPNGPIDVFEFKVVVEQRTLSGQSPVAQAKIGTCTSFPVIADGDSATTTIGGNLFSGIFHSH